jgi:glycosyltransferase involved in cell wall biosynthesis
MNGHINWQLNSDEKVLVKPGLPVRSTVLPLVAILRVRNEGLLLPDTLEHIGNLADFIVVYEDASVDNTFELLWQHRKVAAVIRNAVWRPAVDDRLVSETRHRGLLLGLARQLFSFNWCMCCDADERYVGDIRQFVQSSENDAIEGVRIQLFDAYMTANDHNPYQQSSQLMNFRKWFGPERRDILMLWRNSPEVHYIGSDAREPIVDGAKESKFFCQHYGKSLSIQHWEETCDYYVNHFPYDPYGKKWEKRRGKAIHSESDFQNPLYPWGKDLFANAVLNF